MRSHEHRRIGQSPRPPSRQHPITRRGTSSPTRRRPSASAEVPHSITPLVARHEPSSRARSSSPTGGPAGGSRSRRRSRRRSPSARISATSGQHRRHHERVVELSQVLGGRSRSAARARMKRDATDIARIRPGGSGGAPAARIVTSTSGPRADAPKHGTGRVARQSGGVCRVGQPATENGRRRTPHSPRTGSRRPTRAIRPAGASSKIRDAGIASQHGQLARERPKSAVRTSRRPFLHR